MNKIKEYWIWLSRIKKVGAIKKRKLLQTFGTPKNIWNAKKMELIGVEGIGEKIADEILDDKYKKDLFKYIGEMEKSKIDLITIEDPEYPQVLKNIYDYPVGIYIKGNKNILNNYGLAIVGCRDFSEYGKRVATVISYELSRRDINIISGLARGIDTIAHEASLKSYEDFKVGRTIAVLGGGLNKVYPKENISIFNKIEQYGGAIISEYPIDEQAEKMNFPARNRIISGISQGVIVVEAAAKSGTLITVDFALEQGKNIFAVPGNIMSKNSVGTNELIKQGAKMVTNLKDILEDL